MLEPLSLILSIIDEKSFLVFLSTVEEYSFWGLLSNMEEKTFRGPFCGMFANVWIKLFRGLFWGPSRNGVHDWRLFVGLDERLDKGWTDKRGQAWSLGNYFNSWPNPFRNQINSWQNPLENEFKPWPGLRKLKKKSRAKYLEDLW